MDQQSALRPELPEGTEKSLKANFLFHEQSDDVVGELENLCEWFWCPAGEKVFDRDDTDAEVFFSLTAWPGSLITLNQDKK